MVRIIIDWWLLILFYRFTTEEAKAILFPEQAILTGRKKPLQPKEHPLAPQFSPPEAPHFLVFTHDGGIRGMVKQLYLSTFHRLHGDVDRTPRHPGPRRRSLVRPQRGSLTGAGTGVKLLDLMIAESTVLKAIPLPPVKQSQEEPPLSAASSASSVVRFGIDNRSSTKKLYPIPL